MPKASYIWLKGKDTNWDPPEDNNKPDWDGNNEESNNVLIAVLVPTLFLILVGVGLGIFFYFKKCKKSDENFEEGINSINSKTVDDKK